MALAGLILGALALLLSLLQSLRMGALSRRIRGQSAGRPASASGEVERIEALGTQLASLGNRMDLGEGQARSAIQRVGIVRYNPFEDTGSNQSFVLAMLDAHANGFVLSSLHSRQQTRVFLKPVTAGKTETALSEEEAEAIRRATG